MENYSQSVKPMFNPEVVGYCIEYYITTPNGNNFIGSEVVSEPDREVIGYYGTAYYTATEDILINGGKWVIPKGAEYYTRLVQLNGRDPNFYTNLLKFGNTE